MYSLDRKQGLHVYVYFGVFMPGPAAAKKRGKMTDCRVTRIYDLAIRRVCFLNYTHL